MSLTYTLNVFIVLDFYKLVYFELQSFRFTDI